MADADRQVNVVDSSAAAPADEAPPAKKTVRTTGAAAVLGAMIPSAHADEGLKNQFVAARSATALPNVDREFDALVAGGAAAAKPAAGAAPGEAAAPARAGGDRVSSQSLTSLVTGQEPPQPLAARILAGAKAVGRDVVTGAMGAPKHIIGGLLDAVNNINDLIAHALPDQSGFQLVNHKGEWAPKLMTAEEVKASQTEGEQLRGSGEGHGLTYNMDDPDTVTGNVIRTAVAFLSGRRALAGNPTSTVGNVAADFAGGAAALNPNAPRISNIIDQVAPNFVTDFLKAKPEDEGTLLGHLKSGLEMAGLGSVISGVVKSMKAIKSTLRSMPAQEGGVVPALEGAGEGGAAAGEGAVAAPRLPGKSALDSLMEMESDIPWEKPQPRGAPAGSAGAAAANPGAAAAANAKAAGGISVPPDRAARDALALGYPAPETGSALAPPSEKMATVEVSPELGAKFERYLAQERGELPAPLEPNAKPLAEQASADFSSTGANPVKVNLNMINGPDDLKDAIARVSAQIPAQAVRHNDAVLDAAQSLAMSPSDFMAGPGAALSDAQVVGLRMVTNDVARQFLESAKAAAIPGAAPEARAEALATYAKFNDILSFMEGAKAESGRSVQAWGIKVAGSTVPYTEAVKRLAEVVGGPESAGFLERMGALDTPEQIAGAARAARTMTSRDWMMYGWYNALLCPRTIVKKAMSDTFMGMWNLATRYAAEKFGPEHGVQVGETAALLQGYKSSFTDSLALARKAFLAGRSQFNAGSEYLEAFDHGQALADSAPEISTDAPTTAWRDFMRASTNWKSLMPTTWVGAVDDFATMMNYQAERHALAYRSAAAKGLDGPELEQAVDALESETPSWLHKQAVASAMANTFKEPLTGIAANLKDFFDGANIPIGHGMNFELPIGRIIAPFIKIPINITRWSYTNSPLPLAFPSSRIAQELAAGGASKDLAIARIALGSTLSMSALGLALSGQITGRGPSDPQLQRAWQAAHGGDVRHSVKVGDKYYSYNSTEPVGLMMGVIADTVDIMRYAREEDAGQAALSLVFGAGEALLSKTYLQGTADLFKALQDPDKESAHYLAGLLSTMTVPNTVKDFAHALDPWMRQHYAFLDTIEARLPYISQGLPPQRTLWGDPIPVKDGYMPFLTGTGAAQMLSPITVAGGDAEPIDKWTYEHRLNFPHGADNKLGLTKLGRVQTFSAGPGVSATVELTPAQHDRLQVLAGNALQDRSTGLGAKDTLNALVDGHGPAGLQRQWDNSTDDARALIVQTVVNKFRAAAKQKLLQENPDIQEAVNAGWQSRASALTAH